MKKQILSLLLAAALCAGAVGFTGTSAGASFSDVTDEDTDLAVTVLQGMGIVSGNDDGAYRPDDLLTRDQFCKLAVTAMGLGGQASQYANKALFSDVPGAYWAAGYIYLAYDRGVVSGRGDGTFAPGDSVTYGQAVTILLRMLGYTTSDIGSLWPQDYTRKAEELGLSDGTDYSDDEALTRGGAAILLYNLMLQNNTDGKAYYSTLASSTLSGAIILGNNATADDGTTGAVKTYAGGAASYYQQSVALPDEFVGRRGTVLLNAAGKVSGFIPDEGSCKTVSIASATADSIVGTDGKKYSVPSGAVIILGGKTYAFGTEYYELEGMGAARIYYSEAGVADTIYVADSSSSKVVVAAAGGASATALIESQFGISSGGYSLYKNGCEADASDIAKYDVATYDGATASVLVCGFRLTAVIADASPSLDAAATVTVMGAEFTVLDAAREALKSCSIGDRVTFLFTADGYVAAVLSTGALQAASPVGVLSSVGSVGSLREGEIVRAASSADGISVTAATFAGTSDSLDVSGGALGGLKLAPDVKIYEHVGKSAATAIALSDIALGKVSSSQIDYYETNPTGKVSLLVLDDVTGDRYSYGFLVTGKVTSSSKYFSSSDSEEVQYTNYTVAVKNGDGASSTCYTGTFYTNGSIGGIVGTADGKLAGYARLTKVAKINRSDFSGTETVKVGGSVMKISDGVQVYNTLTEKWITLEAAKAAADSFTVYYDRTPETGGKIRVIMIG